MKKRHEPTVGLDRMGEPIIDPAPDKPPTWEDSPAGKACFKGGAWGMGAGALAAAIYGNSASYSPFGWFVGDEVLVIFGLLGLGYALGALIGWFSVRATGKDEVPPPPSLLGG